MIAEATTRVSRRRGCGRLQLLRNSILTEARTHRESCPAKYLRGEAAAGAAAARTEQSLIFFSRSRESESDDQELQKKREKMQGPLYTLLLPLDTSQLAHFRAFFFAMSFVMTSLSAALPMRASSRAGEFCYSMRSANEPARGARSEKAESRIWWPSSPSPSPSIKSFLFLFASPSRRELATARRLSGSARARVDLVLAVPERVAASRERTTARSSSCRSTTVWQFRSTGGGGGRRRRNQKEIIRRRNRRRIGHFRASRSTQSCLLYETSRKRMRINSFDGGNLRGQLEGPAETRDQINRRRRREKKNSPPFSSLLSLLFRPPTPPP